MKSSDYTPHQLSKRYLKALLKGDEASASQALDTALQQGLSAKSVYLSVLVPAQTELGNLWHAQKITVAIEHIGTQITLSQMGRLRPLFKRKKPHGKAAMITALAGDTHTIGGRMASDLLYIDGWQVDFLGDAPSNEIFNLVQNKKPDLLGLSVSMSSFVKQAEQLVSSIKTGKYQPKIIIGGLAVQEDKQKFLAVGADATLSDSKDLLNTVRATVGLPLAYRSIEDRLKIIGDKIATQRKSLRMSQQNLGDNAGLDRAYISSIEHGKQNITIGALLRISQALDLSLEEMVDE